MFRQVIPQMIKNSRIIKNMQFSTDTIDNNIKLEKSINQVTLLGRVGGEAQKKGSDEHPVVTFSLATHNNYKYVNGDFVQQTDWHKICVFKPNLRENVYTYLRKGQRVLVSGKISYGEYKNEEGIIKSTATVIADDVIFFHHN